MLLVGFFAASSEKAWFSVPKFSGESDLAAAFMDNKPNETVRTTYMY
jgi:hypothetical protein